MGLLANFCCYVLGFCGHFCLCLQELFFRRCKFARYLLCVADPSISDMLPTACAASLEEKALTNRSHKILATYCQRNRITFFLSAPYKVQIALLQRTERMFSVQLQLPYYLADALNLSFDDVRRWLNKRLLRNLETADKPEFTDDKVIVLKEELGLALALNYEYTLLLGYVLQLPPAAIRMWFEREKAKVTGGPIMDRVEELTFVVPNSVSQPPVTVSSGNSKSATSQEKRVSSQDDSQVVQLLSFDEFQFCRGVKDIVEKRKTNFFYALPLSTQVALVKCVHSLPSAYQPILDKVAHRLGLSVFQLMAWIGSIRCKYVEINKSTFVPPLRNGLLNEEFTENETLSEERALVLSYIMEIPFSGLSDWFYNRRVLNLLSAVAADPGADSGEFEYLKHFVKVSQFKKFALCSDKEAKDLADRKEAGPFEGRSWSDSTQQYVRLLKMNDILQKLFYNYPPEKVKYLDGQYRTNKGIFGPHDVESLATNLMMTEQDVVDWLNWRLLYELSKVYGEKLSIWIKEECYHKIYAERAANSTANGSGAKV